MVIDPDTGPASIAAARRLALSRLSASLQRAEDEGQIMALLDDLQEALLHEQATASEPGRLKDLVAELLVESEPAAPARRHEQATAAAQTETLSELLPTLPHELSQPLTIVSGYAELLAAGRLTDQALLDACHELVEASHRLADLARRLDRAASQVRNDVGVGRGTIDFEQAGE